MGKPQGRGQGGQERGERGGGRGHGQFRKRNTKFYCWTHGACAHIGQYCNFPTEGNLKNALFSNKLGGATRTTTLQINKNDFLG